MGTDRLQILVVEDEAKIAEVVKSYLENSGFSVFSALDGHQALKLYKSVHPDLIILDLMLPDISGEDFCKTIRKESDVPIIMLTAKVEEESILKGLDIGADDYVTKPFSPKQLVARVKAVLRRTDTEKTPKTGHFVLKNGSLIVDTVNYEVIREGESINLTPVEFKILAALVKYPNKVFTREELISLVLGDDFEGYDRTIDTHVKNVRQKLERDSRNPQYILTVHGVGYRFGGE